MEQTAFLDMTDRSESLTVPWREVGSMFKKLNKTEIRSGKCSSAPSKHEITLLITKHPVTLQVKQDALHLDVISMLSNVRSMNLNSGCVADLIEDLSSFLIFCNR